MIGFSTRVTRSGPLFNGAAARAARDFAEDWEEEVGEFALSVVRRIHTASFKNPTGYYESHVRLSSDNGDPVIHDGGVIAYGPWLEGVGSRNSTTRFKGYHAFRKAAIAAERRANSIGERLLDRRYLRRMN